MKKVKINHDYFTLNTKFEQFENFIKQGNIIHHSIDRFKWYFGPKFFYVFDFPTHIDIETSSLCQMKCPMCMTHLMKQKKGNMAFDLFKRIIDECAKENVYSVKLSWRGEPLLNPEIVKMVKYAKDKKIKDVAFLTNGERLNPEIISELIGAGLDWLSISFDGYEKEVYESIRKPAIFEKVIENVKFIRSERERLKLKKPIIRAQTIFSAIEKNPGKYWELWNGIADKINFIADEDRSSSEKKFIHDPNYICQSPWQRICVMWDGRIAQCHSDYLEGNILGDFNKNTLKEIWNGNKFNELRRLMKNYERLKTKPCNMCCDGGFYEEKSITVNGKNINIIKYKDQKSIDIKND
ncbi:MAG TPA: radical SAM protein [bacterium]|nr:radical SAM protein [bacterium]